MIQTETWSVGIQTDTWSVDYRVGQKNDNVPTSAERNPARPMFSSPPLAVLSFLSNEELYNASLVSKWWNRLALDDSASASPTKKEDSLPRKVLQLQAPLAVIAFLSNEELYNFIESRAFKAELSESSAPTGAPNGCSNGCSSSFQHLHRCQSCSRNRFNPRCYPVDDGDEFAFQLPDQPPL